MRLCIVQFGERLVKILFVVPDDEPDDLPFALCHIGKGTFFSEHLRIVAQKRPVVFRQRAVEKALVKAHGASGNVPFLKFTN